LAVTDSAVLSEVQSHLVETIDGGVTWSSGFWTTQEVIDYSNQRQRQFLRDSLILIDRTSLVTIPNVLRHPLPQDWVATQRVVFKDSATPANYTHVPRSDNYESDLAIPTWPYNQAQLPSAYSDGDQATLTLETFPAVNVPGQLQILFVKLSTTLSNAGAVDYTVPDEFVPSIKWGIMADMLGKVGRGHDPQRSGFCEQRYQEGVEAARVILGGWQ